MTGEEKTGEAGELEGLDTTGFTEEELATLTSVAEAEEVEEPEKAPEKEPEGEEPEHPNGYVPLRALHEAREKLKSREESLKSKESELGELRQWQARLAEKLADLKTGKEPEQPDQIDPNEDPMGYIQQVGQTVEQLKQFSQQTAAQQQETQIRQAQETAVVDNVLRYRADLVKQDPETAKAFDYAVESTVKAYQERGYTGNALREAIKAEVIRYAQNAPKDPEQLKQYTRQNAWFWGYGQGQPEPEKQPAKEQIDKLAAAQAASKTLSGGGTSGSPEITLEDIENLSGAELDKLALKDPDFFARIEAMLEG
jgi:hypothetical protein